MPPADVDVLIPVYNGAETLNEAVASIQAQSLRNIRIVVVDDGSTDGTAEILDRLATADERLHVIRQQNGGIVDALNRGLAACAAPLIARHDADDLAAPDRLERQKHYLDAHLDCVAVSCAVEHMDAAGRPLTSASKPLSPDRADPFWAPSIEPYLIHPFLTVRRSALLQVGGYRHAEHAEDTDLYWRLRDLGRLHNMPERLGRYRLHGGSITGASVRNGRVGAAAAQRSALSARRRAASRADLAFPKNSAEYRAVTGYGDLLALAEEGMDADERAYFRVALAGKMLELASYKPYDLAMEDARFIRRTLAGGPPVGIDNRRRLSADQAAGAARLLHRGHVGRALALVPPRLYLPALARLGARILLPVAVRRWILSRLADRSPRPAGGP